MRNTNSVICTINLAQALGIDEIPVSRRSERWWDMFWWYMGLQEAQRIREQYENNIKKFAGRK